jgi:hypothetical protein
MPPPNGDSEGFGIGCPMLSAGRAEFDETVVLEAAEGKGGILEFFQEVKEKGDRFENFGICTKGEETADEKATMVDKRIGVKLEEIHGA